MKTRSGKYIRFIQIYSFWSWLVVLGSFILSFTYAMIDENWGMIGWIAPLIVMLIVIFLFAILLAYYLLVVHNKNNRTFTLFLFEKEYKIYENNFICLLGKILFYLMLVIYVLSFYPIILTLVSYLILFGINNVLNRENV